MAWPGLAAAAAPTAEQHDHRYDTVDITRDFPADPSSAKRVLSYEMARFLTSAALAVVVSAQGKGNVPVALYSVSIAVLCKSPQSEVCAIFLSSS
jgi:hypothetical protein